MSIFKSKQIKVIGFSCLGLVIVGILMFSGWLFVAVKLFSVSQRNNEKIKNLPVVTGTLSTSDSLFLSPIEKKQASLIMLVTYYDKPGGRRKTYTTKDFSTLIFPKKLILRVNGKDYQVQPPENMIYLNQRADDYFPNMHKSADLFGLKRQTGQSSMSSAEREVLQRLSGHSSLLNCILRGLSSGEGSCTGISSMRVYEHYYTQHQVVTLKGKIAGNKFLLMDLTSAE